MSALPLISTLLGAATRLLSHTRATLTLLCLIKNSPTLCRPATHEISGLAAARKGCRYLTGRSLIATSALHPVFAILFGEIQQFVATCQQLLRIFIWKQFRQTNADSHRQRVSINLYRGLFDLPTNSFQDVAPGFQVNANKKHEKFFATVSHGHIGTASNVRSDGV